MEVLGICTIEPAIVNIVKIWPTKTLVGLLIANLLMVSP